ncbi:MAG: glycerophosphodiester phosphodiesterase family protein [Pseudomonadota bacterium]
MLGVRIAQPKTTDPGRVIAHRGASMTAPENTLAAFREAARQGARWIEFDVSLLGDKTPVIFHDATLDRCTRVSGCLTDLKVDDLASIDAGSWHSKIYEGERIPKLTQCLDMIAESGLFANLEIKPHSGDPVEIAEIVARELTLRNWAKSSITVSSFSIQTLSALRSLRVNQPLAVLWRHPPDDWAITARELEAEAIHVEYTSLTSELLLEARRRKIGLRVYTINRPELIEQFRNLGLLGVITDHPLSFFEDPSWLGWSET